MLQVKVYSTERGYCGLCLPEQAFTGRDTVARGVDCVEGGLFVL